MNEAGIGVQMHLNPERLLSAIILFCLHTQSKWNTHSKQTEYNEGKNKRKLATELKISAQKNKTGVTATTAIRYENIPFVSLWK